MQFVHQCNKKRETHIDHIIPLADGGSNDDDNLQMLCKECNFEQHKKNKQTKNTIKLQKQIHPTIIKFIKF